MTECSAIATWIVADGGPSERGGCPLLAVSPAPAGGVDTCSSDRYLCAQPSAGGWPTEKRRLRKLEAAEEVDNDDFAHSVSSSRCIKSCGCLHRMLCFGQLDTDESGDGELPLPLRLSPMPLSPMRPFRSLLCGFLSLPCAALLVFNSVSTFHHCLFSCQAGRGCRGPHAAGANAGGTSGPRHRRGAAAVPWGAGVGFFCALQCDDGAGMHQVGAGIACTVVTQLLYHAAHACLCTDVWGWRALAGTASLV